MSPYGSTRRDVGAFSLTQHVSIVPGVLVYPYLGVVGNQEHREYSHSCLSQLAQHYHGYSYHRLLCNTKAIRFRAVLAIWSSPPV